MSGLRNVLGVVATLTGKSDLQDPAAACSALVKAANSTPLNVGVGASSTLSLLHKQHPQYAAAIRQQQERIAALLRRVVDAVEAGSGGEVEAALAGADPDIRPATDFLDRVRETAEIFIDEARGQDSSQQVAALQSHLSAAAEGSGGVSSRAGVGAGSGIPASKKGPQQSWNVSRKPQAAFPDAIDNSRERPFVHKLTAKYHAHARQTPSAAAATQTVPHVPAAGVHPYTEELQHLAYQPQQLQVPEGAETAEFASLDDVPCAFIDSPAELQHLLTYLTTGVVPAGLTASAARFAAAQAYAAGKTQSAGAKPVSGGSAAGSGADATPAAVSVSSSASAGAGSDAAPVPPTELAIDLEAHSFRSFQGFTCLMQLSTRSHDFLVDTLALRPHLHVLNRVFADPAVVKVLHGCDSDVVWLQRDFGLFLVNVFDTGQAARALGFPSAGLAYLLQTYARVTANKQYQMADWRERPLPPQMLKYAREDTHYLLGIYDRLRAELAAASTTTAPLRVAAAGGGAKGRGSSAAPSGSVPVPDLLATVLERSRELCCQQYEKEGFPQDGYRRLMQRMGLLRTAPVSGHLTGVASIAASAFGGAAPASAASSSAAGAGVGVESVADESGSPRSRVFAALFDWRDAVARAEDESTGYIMPNRLLSRLAEVRPESVDALVRACNPLPALLRSNAGEVVRLVNAAVSAAAAAAKAADAAVAAAGASGTSAGAALSGAEATQTQQQAAVGQKRRRDAAGADCSTAASVTGERAVAQGGEEEAADDAESPTDVPVQGGGVKRPRLLQDLERSRLAGLAGAARARGLLSSAEVLALGRVRPPPEPAAARVVKSGAGAGAGGRGSKTSGAGAAPATAAAASAAAGRVTSMFRAFAGSDSEDAGCAASSASDGASAGACSDAESGGMDVDGAGGKPLSAREAARRAAAVRASIGKMSLHDVLGLTEFYAAAAAHAAEADAAASEAAAAAPSEAAAAATGAGATAAPAPAATSASSAKPVAAAAGKLQHASGLTEEEVTGGITSLVQRHGKGKAQPKQPEDGASAGSAAAPAAAPAFDYAAAAAAVPAAANMKATLQKAVEVAAATVVPRGHNPYSKRGRGRGGKR
jgi:ribonuclease D